MGEPAKALGYLEQGLAMQRRLYPPSRFKDGHPYLARSLNHLGGVLSSMGEPAKALGYFEQALAMYRRLYPEARFKDGHPGLAASLNNLGTVLESTGELAKARRYHEEALAMYRRLYPEARFKDGHPDLAASLNNLGYSLNSMGEPAKALGYLEQGLAMQRRLYPEARFKDGHPYLADSLSNLAGVLGSMGEPAKALGYFEQALAMRQRISDREVIAATESQALAYLRSFPRTRDLYLNTALLLPPTASACYEPVFASRARFLRLVHRRHESAQVALLKSADARETWQQLGNVRRRIARLLVEPGKDLVDRDRQLTQLEASQTKLEREMVKLLPEIEERARFAKATPSDFAAKLPATSAFVDVIRCAHYEKTKPAGWRYLAFVLLPGKPVQRVELRDAEAIDRAILSWRSSIDKREPSRAPALLRKSVWEPIERLLPPDTKTVYLQLDGELARLPFAGLPGRGKDSVLLEDYALATVPAGAWLQQQLEKPARKDDGSLVAAGDVNFGPAPAGRKPYDPLKDTGREVNRVLEAFARPDVALRGDKATARALRERLPHAAVAHMATHAYYDVKSLDVEYDRIRKQRESWTPTDAGTQRVGLGARNPLGFVGLVLSGGNDPSKAPDGGILTGLEILELPLEKMHLCVLSACETGLGEWDELAGVSGLQLAFHVAGCRNVVGSLWNVNDAATAALMTQFYHELRVNKKTPLEALRTAQLTIYRHPERIADLAGDRGRPALEKAAALGTRAPAPAAKGKKADTKLWAAFVLSGPGN